MDNKASEMVVLKNSYFNGSKTSLVEFYLMRPDKPHSSHTVWSDFAWYIITTIALIALVTIAGFLLIRQQKTFILNEKQKELSTIADLKVSEIIQWRKEKLAEAASISANTMMSHRVEEFYSGRSNETIRQEFKTWMTKLVELGGYSKATLFTNDGKIITSSTEPKTQSTQHYLDHVTKAAAEKKLILSDFHNDFTNSPYDIDLTVPILLGDGSDFRCVAVLILDIDPGKRLYPLIQSWPSTSDTAETLLVKRDGDSVLFLNQVRHLNQSPPHRLSLSNEAMPAVKAALGHEGNFTGVDYRSKEVLCAIRVVPDTKWGLVTKIDISEVLAPLSRTILYVIITGVMVNITMILGLFLWNSRRKAEELGKLFEIEQKHTLELKNAEAELLVSHSGLEQQIFERTRDLSEINTILRQEIAEREQLEQRLISAKRLEAIGQIAGGVAHEVRNPLNAILTITEALFKEKEIENNPEFEPFIHHIRTQVNRLVHLMNDLLDLGRTIPATNLQPLTLYNLCRETIDLWKSTGMVKNKLALLTSDGDDISIQVAADALKLQQVFFNLLENAGHHTPENSKIMVRILDNNSAQSHNMAVVHIIDQGTGIPEDRLSHVFDPFYTDRKGGTGLGLALVKHFLENMGGSVQIWNNTPPPGCTVEVRIPIHLKELQ
jgi:signal transduction histidine kinase